MGVVLSELKTELATDPVTLGYAAVANDEYRLANLCLILNDKTLRTVIKKPVMSQEILDQCDETELGTVCADTTKATAFFGLLGMGRIDPASTMSIKVMKACFGDTSTTITNLASWRTESGSRAEELWGRDVSVRPKDILEAEAL